ncbi:MAG TPA: NAAT family transporter [Methanofastidiosum sp.]|nr:NAAT family transporter [Methanofastidiosum sp.]HOC78404.1 NAAT family transporter [Methanofastidiosum sp.]HOG74225.1 NAAT family transporter [Methanofastidiosum sp.]HQQ48957.1 NAAT family transporter [Methanofastidiosum sp.]
MDAFAFFVFALTSIFVIVNPVGAMFTFMSLTSDRDYKERVKIGSRSVLIAFLVAIVFAIGGEIILRFFGVTVDSLRVAGGIILFKVALDMVYAKTSGESFSEAERKDAKEREDISVFPVAMPLLTGPGTITTVIVVIRSVPSIELKMVALLAMFATFLITFLMFRFSNELSKILGVTVTLVFTRIMGLLLGAIAINFLATGIKNIFMAML